MRLPIILSISICVIGYLATCTAEKNKQKNVNTELKSESRNNHKKQNIEAKINLQTNDVKSVKRPDQTESKNDHKKKVELETSEEDYLNLLDEDFQEEDLSDGSEENNDDNFDDEMNLESNEDSGQDEDNSSEKLTEESNEEQSGDGNRYLDVEQDDEQKQLKASKSRKLLKIVSGIRRYICRKKSKKWADLGV